MSLITALHSHDARLVEVICSSGASCNELIDGATPMHIAVGIQSSHDYMLTNTLLQYGGDPNITSEDGLTPVHVAVIWNKSKILKLLLDNGGDPKIQDEEEEDAWDKSVKYRQTKCQKVLRQHLKEISTPKQEGDNSKQFVSIFNQNIPVYDTKHLTSFHQQDDTTTYNRKSQQLQHSRLSTQSSVSSQSVDEFDRGFIEPTLDISPTYGDNSKLTSQYEVPIAPPRRKSLKNKTPISYSEPTSLTNTPTKKRGLFKKVNSVIESRSRSFDEVDSAHTLTNSTHIVDNSAHQSLVPPPSIGDRTADLQPTRQRKKSLKLKMARVIRRCNSTPGKLVSFDVPDSPKLPQTSIVRQNTPTSRTNYTPANKTLTPSTNYTPHTVKNQNSFTPKSCDCTIENGSIVSPCNVHHTTPLNQTDHKTKRKHSIGKILNKLSPKRGKAVKSISPPAKPPRTLKHLGSSIDISPQTKSSQSNIISENDIRLLMTGQAVFDTTDPDDCVVTPANKDKSAEYRRVQSPIKLTSSRGKSRIVDKDQLDQIISGHSVFDCTSPDHPMVVNTICESGSTRLDYTICEQELSEELDRILSEDSPPAARKSLFTDSGNESQRRGSDDVMQRSAETQTEDDIFTTGGDELCSLHLNPQISNLHVTQDCSKQVSPGSGTHVSISQDSGIELLPLNTIKHRWGDNSVHIERRNSIQSESSFHTCNSESVDSQYSVEVASLPTETDSLINKVTRMNISVSPERDSRSSDQHNQHNDEILENSGTINDEPTNNRKRHDSITSIKSTSSIAEFLYTDFDTNITLCEHRLPTDLQDITNISMFTELNTTGAFDVVTGALNTTNEALNLTSGALNMTSGALNLSWRANKSLSELVNEESESIPDSISNLSDEELRRELEMFGIRPGPINRATKRLYQLRLNRIKRDPNLHTSDQNKNYYSVELRQYLIGHTSVDLSKISDLEQKLVAQFDCDSTTGERKKWREGNSKMSFTYLLLDPRTTINLPARHNTLEMERPGSSFEIFLSSIFYVGKGKKTRPYQHFVDAIRNKNVERELQSEKLTQIHQIWDEKFGVVSLHVFHNMIPVEAYTREACMVDSIGLKNLTNVASCNYYGLASTWSSRDRKLVGASFLRKAFQIYMIEGERQIRPSDIRSNVS